MQGFGTVKSVLSGDTVILIGNSSKGPAPEMQLSLAFCQAPRVARSAEGIEEAFGWESREFLRKMVIGQVVKFKVVYKVDAISRSFATLELKNKNVLHEMVSNGMVSVRTERDDHGQKDLYEELIDLQTSARDNHRGIWGAHRAVRNVIWTLPDPEAFFKANKGFPMAAVIEQVRDGSTFKCYLLEGGEYITLHLAGIQSPRITYSSNGEATYEAFSQEARTFSEVRLLNRSILLYLDGMDKFNNFFGRIEHPKGNITLELLKAGLSRMVDWSANFLPNSEIAELRGGEVAAKQQRLRLWKDWKPASTSYDSIEGQVLQVLSGDTLIILLNDKSPIYMGSQRRVNLASIKAPKIGNAKKNVPDEPWAQEAKDALIKMAIGRKVKMTVEYDRTVSVPEETTYTYCTVMLEGKTPINLGEEMVKKGLVSVVRHRQDDPRAENYDQLLIAEDKAKAGKKGMHGKAGSRSMRRVDYSETPTKAKTSLHFLKQQKQHQGIIEYVFSAAHYLIYVPSENCQFSFTLQGVKAPQNSGKGKPEPFGDESLMYAKYNYLQRSVTVEVNNCDKVGNYIGDLYLPNDKNPISLSLLRNGVCYINENSIDFCARAEEMERLEEEAMTQRKGYWMNHKVEEKPKETAVTGEMDVLITYVKSGNTFFGNSSLDKANVSKVNNAMDKLPIPNNMPVVKPVKTTVYGCIDRTSSSPCWIRARILNIKGSTVTVKAIDRGYEFETTTANLRELDEDIRAIPALARECILAGVEVPPTGNWSIESRDCFDDLADDLCHARVVLRDAANRLAVFLYRENEPTSINEMMLQEGWGRLEKNAYSRYAGYSAILDSMKKYEAGAKEDRVGIYERGDIGFGDESFVCYKE